MGSISFGGDPSNFMDPPMMENKALTDVIGGGGGSFIASLLDLVGIHRQVAKGPKEGEADPAAAGANPSPDAKAASPSVLNDVESALGTPPAQAAPIAPIQEDSPMSEWGKRWISSLSPITTFDPGASSAGQ